MCTYENVVRKKEDYDRKRKELQELVSKTAADFHAKGGKIEINHKLPYVSITRCDGSEYFFQGEEVDQLLAQVLEDMNEEEYIIWLAQGW